VVADMAVAGEEDGRIKTRDNSFLFHKMTFSSQTRVVVIVIVVRKPPNRGDRVLFGLFAIMVRVLAYYIVNIG
jgi:hypothetical protein